MLQQPPRAGSCRCTLNTYFRSLAVSVISREHANFTIDLMEYYRIALAGQCYSISAAAVNITLTDIWRKKN